MSPKTRYTLVLLALLGCSGNDDGTTESGTSSASSPSSTTSTTTATDPTTTTATTTTATTGAATDPDPSSTGTGPTGTTTGGPVCEGIDAFGACAAAECCAEKTACQDDPGCEADLLCVFETCTLEMVDCRSSCNTNDNDAFDLYVGCLLGNCVSECPRCARVPDFDSACDFLGERMPEAWECPPDGNLQGPCSWAATPNWEGYCCPAGYPGASMPPL